MPLPNYYVGSDLSAIGHQMQQDRGLDAQQAMAQLQQRYQMAALLQQLREREAARAQQGQQFGAELALRQAAQQQVAQHQAQQLGLSRDEMALQDRSGSARLVNAIKLAEMQGQSAKDVAMVQFPLERWHAEDSRVSQERLKQDEINKRDHEIALENWDQSKSVADARANQYNALLNSIKQQAEEEKKKGSQLFTSQKAADANSKKLYQTGRDELIRQLQGDRLSEHVTFDPVTDSFLPSLPAKPNYRQFLNQLNATSGPPTGLPGVPAFLSQPQGIGQQSNPAVQPEPSAQMIRVRTSNGKILEGPASEWPILQRSDPNAVIIGRIGASALPPPPRVNTGGASGSWEQPEQQATSQGLLDSLRNYFNGAGQQP